MKRIIIYLSIAFLSVFCFAKAQAQAQAQGVTMFGISNPSRTTDTSKTWGQLVVPYLATSDSNKVLGVTSTGHFVLRNDDGGADSTIFATQYQLDTAKDNIRGEIASIPTPTLQAVTDAGDTTTNTINVNGLFVSGFERAPAQFDGGAAIYLRRYHCTGCTVDTAYGNSIHSVIDRSVLSIGNNKSFASFDALPAIYSDSVMNMSAMTGFQNNSIWDYPVGSILDKMYGFNSVLVPKTGTVNSIYDFYAHHLDNTGTFPTVGDHYAFYSEDFSGSKTATRNHGIHILGSGSDNYFAGNVGIGDTNRGSYKLEVNGSANIVNNIIVGDSVTFTDYGTSAPNDTVLSANASGNLVKSYLGTNYFRNGGNSFSSTAVIGTNTQQNLELETNNTTRLLIDANGHLHTSNAIGVYISPLNTSFRDVIIGAQTTVPTGTNYRTIIGHQNRWNTARSAQMIYGYFNRCDETATDEHLLYGISNRVQSADAGQILIGNSNTVNYTGATTSRYVPTIIGGLNTVSHKFSTVIGSFQTTTAENQLIIGMAQNNVNTGWYDVYLGGQGVRAFGSNTPSAITWNAGGAASGTDKDGSALRIAAGKSTGAAVPKDITFATATALASGTTLQSLTDRWYVKGNTGILANTSSPSASAAFQVNSTTQGILPPRMTGAQAEAISSPAEGLLIYSTDGTGATITSKGWWGYDGTNWVKLN